MTAITYNENQLKEMNAKIDTALESNTAPVFIRNADNDIIRVLSPCEKNNSGNTTFFKIPIPIKKGTINKMPSVTLKITKYFQYSTSSQPFESEYTLSFYTGTIFTPADHYFDPGYGPHQAASDSVFPIKPSLAYIPGTDNYLFCFGQKGETFGHTIQVTEIKTNMTLPEDFDYKNMILTGSLPADYEENTLP
jgi:hypothetical protein